MTGFAALPARRIDRTESKREPEKKSSLRELGRPASSSHCGQASNLGEGIAG